MNYEQFNRRFPRHSRVVVRGWDLHENEVFEVVYSDPDTFLLRSEKTGIGYEVSYLCEDLSNYSLVRLTFEDITPGDTYVSRLGEIKVLGKSLIDKKIAIQFDDGSLDILSEEEINDKLNQE
jgi:hypothetical protein